MKKVFFYCNCICFSLLSLFFSSCEKENEINDELPIGKGVLILNQGSWKSNNAGLSFKREETGTVFYDIQNGKMGDNAQSMFIFGSKLFVAVSGSARILAIDLESKQTLAEISLQGEGNAVRQPRYFATDGNKIYVSTYDGYVLCLNPQTYSVEKAVQVGPNPEGIAVVGEKIYVSISDGENFMEGYVNGKSVSVIGIASFSVEASIPVMTNPTLLQADGYGDLYVISNGDYSMPGAMQRIETSTRKVSVIEGISASNFSISGDICYYYNIVYDDQYNPVTTTIGTFNVKTEEAVTSQFISDGTSISTPYGIGIDPQNGNVFISNTDYSNPGEVYVFNSAGKFREKFQAGINACCFAFY